MQEIDGSVVDSIYCSSRRPESVPSTHSRQLQGDLMPLALVATCTEVRISIPQILKYL